MALGLVPRAAEAPSSEGDLADLHCELMDGFAVAVQLTLATVAFGSLGVKRYRERPQRPLKIWLFDTSKQAIAASMVHVVNVTLSYLSGAGLDDAAAGANPCVWYFLNILLDTTVGVGILYLFLRLLARLAHRLAIADVEPGYYGMPPRVDAWLKQLAMFALAWLGVKIAVVAVLSLFPGIFVPMAAWLLWPFSHGGPRLQVVFVMLLFPLVMNICQAWLIDTLIKDRQYGHQPLGSAHRHAYASPRDAEAGVGGRGSGPSTVNLFPMTSLYSEGRRHGGAMGARKSTTSRSSLHREPHSGDDDDDDEYELDGLPSVRDGLDPDDGSDAHLEHEEELDLDDPIFQDLGLGMLKPRPKSPLSRAHDP